VAVGITDRAVPVYYCGHWLELAVVTDTEVAYRGPSIPSNGQCVMQLKNSMYCFWDVQQHHSGFCLPFLMPRLSFIFNIVFIVCTLMY